MKVVTYRRVSSTKQASDDRLSLDAQLSAIDALCHRYAATSRIDLIDSGRSSWRGLANIIKQPELLRQKLPRLAEVLDLVDSGDVDAVVIGADPDRVIGRRGGLQSVVFASLADARVKLINPLRSFDPNDPYDYQFLRGFGVQAEMESMIKSHRVIAAKKQKATERGIGNFAAVVNQGYKRDTGAEGGLSIVEDEAEIVRFVLESYVSGALSTRGIALAVRQRFPDAQSRSTRSVESAFTVGTVVSICRHARFYAGQVHYKGEWFPGHHAPIIDIDLAERVEGIPQTGRVAPHTSATRLIKNYLFTKLIRCYDCGQRFGQDWRNGKASYRGEARRKLRDCQVCAGKYISERAIEADLYPVMDQLREMKRAEVDGQLKAVRPDLVETAEKRLKALKAKRYRVGVNWADGIYEGHEEEYRAERDRLEREITALTPASMPQVKTALDDPMWEMWGNARTRITTEELRQFFARTLTAIFCDAGDKTRSIRFITPSPSLRVSGVDRLYVGLASHPVPGEVPDVTLDVNDPGQSGESLYNVQA